MADAVNARAMKPIPIRADLPANMFDYSDADVESSHDTCTGGAFYFPPGRGQRGLGKKAFNS
jgi:hypothetical protein